MFEAAELGREVSKEEYAARLPKLRAGLLEAQLGLREAKVPVIVVVSGADGAGKSETVNRLHEWLDPRGLETNVFGPLSDEERDRPPYWRFWRTLPARGRIGIFFGSWYTDPIIRRVYGKTRRAELDEELNRIAFFERMLVEEGALIIKFWLHLAKKAQRKRLEALEADRKTRWRVSPLDWKHFKLYDSFVKTSEWALRRTDAGYAPWFVIEAADDRYRELTVGRTLLDAMRRRISEGPRKVAGNPGPAGTTVKPPAKETAKETAREAAKGGGADEAPAATANVLAAVDLTQSLTPKEYSKRLAKLQARIHRLVHAAWEKKVSSVAMFEGWDAAGKGGCIRRLTEAMDARSYRVIPIAAPTDEERAHHYLWRFWRHIPRAGSVTIYDRSWYGRVLVERIEGFAKEPEWMRAYQEINDFEEQLLEHGVALTKFWIHIGKDEQLRRFEARQTTAYKQHKITDEDWRNREKWEAYEAAIGDMVTRTSTHGAPWTLVAGNDKRFARIQVLDTFCARLEAAL